MGSEVPVPRVAFTAISYYNSNMTNYRTNRIIQIVIVVLLVVLVVIGLTLGIRAALSKRTVTTDTTQSTLLSTTADRSVRLTVRGPLSADENFRSYDIVISPNVRTLTVYSSYLKVVTKQVNLNNNIPAYEQFVYALDKAGFMTWNETTNNDERGLCSTGKLYEFETLQNGKSIKKLWTSACARGNTKSSYTTINSLFNKQIPDSTSIINHVW